MRAMTSSIEAISAVASAYGALWLLGACASPEPVRSDALAPAAPLAGSAAVAGAGAGALATSGTGGVGDAPAGLAGGAGVSGAAAAGSAAPASGGTGGASGASALAGSGGEGGMAAVSGMGAAGSAGSEAGASSQSATPSAGCGKTEVPASGPQTLDVDGTEREYIVTVPGDYDPARPHRLIFAWHGLGGSATMIASSYYGLLPRSEGSAIFIAGQGLPGTGQQSGFASWSNTGDRDIAFTRAMLQWAKDNYCIDLDRVFSIGMSNGGLMSNLVGCELGEEFRAISAMSGGGPEGYAMAPCTGQVAVWIAHGNTDDNVPFSYGEGSRDHWTEANHCDTATAPVTPEPCIAFQGCDDGHPVHFCEFDGGHMVPSFAGEASWSFFAAL